MRGPPTACFYPPTCLKGGSWRAQASQPWADKLMAARNWCLVEERPKPSEGEAQAQAHRHHGLHGRVGSRAYEGSEGSTPATPNSFAMPPRSVFDRRATPETGSQRGGQHSFLSRLSRKHANPMLPSGITLRELGSLRFELRVENSDKQEASPTCYSVIAPTYVHSRTGAQLTPLIQSRLERILIKHC